MCWSQCYCVVVTSLWTVFCTEWKCSCWCQSNPSVQTLTVIMWLQYLCFLLYLLMICSYLLHFNFSNTQNTQWPMKNTYLFLGCSKSQRGLIFFVILVLGNSSLFFVVHTFFVIILFGRLYCFLFNDWTFWLVLLNIKPVLMFVL